MSSEQELFNGAIHRAVVKNEELASQGQDTFRVLEGHLHYARVNQVKLQEQRLPDEERAKYERRYRDHLRYLAKIALDLSMEGVSNAVETNTAV